jgi:integrase
MGIEYGLRRRYTKDGTLNFHAEFTLDDRDGHGRRQRVALRSLNTDNEQEAHKRALTMLGDGTITDSRESVESWFTWFWTEGESTYLETKAAQNRPVSTSYAAHNRKWLSTYFYPYAKKRRWYKLSDLEPLGLTEWVLWIRRTYPKLAGRTINEIRQAVGVALNWAYRKRLISHDVMGQVDRVGEDPTPRNAFEPEHIRALLAYHWPDPRTKTAFLLAASGGLRLGECRGLRSDAVNLPERYLTVRTNWIDGEGLKQPKSKAKTRVVPLPAQTVTALTELNQENPYPEPRFVLWGESPDAPITRHLIRADLTEAMKANGITGLSFHSARHFYISFMRHRVGDARLMSVVGHTQVAVTDGYTHLLEADHDTIRQSIAGAFQEVKGN